MRLMDRLIGPVKEYVSFPDLMYSLSSFNNEPLSDVVYYLECRDLESLSIYSIDMKYNIESMKYAQEWTHKFLEDVSAILTLATRTRKWVLKDSDSLDELPDDIERKLTEIFDAHAQIYFKVSELLSFAPLNGYLHFLELDLEKDESAESQSNNSLASYMTEYTLPQVVALILHIDLADITTNASNSYIHEQGKYDESIYHKFNNLLQSYSVAALNNKIDGADVFTRTIESFFGAPDTKTDIEKTTISRGKLASYLDSIGYQLDDLIAKQEPAHTQHYQYDACQQDDSELVSSLQQQVAELQSRLDKKDEELKEKSAKLETAQDKIKELGKATSSDKQLSDNTANDYQVTIGALLELLRTPKGFDKDGKLNTPLFRTQTAIVEAVMNEMLPNHAETKVSTRFSASNTALAKAKKKRDSELDYKAALADKLKKKADLST